MATVLLSGNGPNKRDKEDFWVSGGVWNHKVGLDFLFFMILGAIPEEVYSVCDGVRPNWLPNSADPNPVKHLRDVSEQV